MAGMGVGAMAMTFSTPGTFMAAAASQDLALPNTTGGRAITAYFMPGTEMSWAYMALPMVMSRRSVI